MRSLIYFKNESKIIEFSHLDLNNTYTYADYLTWRFQERVELLEGWIYKMDTAPRCLHQENAVRESWLVNPEEKSFQQFYLKNDEYIKFETIEDKDDMITSKIFPKLKFLANEVF